MHLNLLPPPSLPWMRKARMNHLTYHLHRGRDLDLSVHCCPRSLANAHIQEVLNERLLNSVSNLVLKEKYQRLLRVLKPETHKKGIQVCRPYWLYPRVLREFKNWECGLHIVATQGFLRWMQKNPYFQWAVKIIGKNKMEKIDLQILRPSHCSKYWVDSKRNQSIASMSNW